MTTATVTPEIAAFAAGVRAALADLPAEERDELTEGLELDLAEAYAEDLARELPDPAAYAEELRTAAGLPRRAPARRGVADVWRSTRRDLEAVVRRSPALSAVAEFLAVVRPVWWIVRAWVAVWLLQAVFGAENGVVPTSGWLLVLLALVVVSVQWGRGRWTFRGLAPLLVVGNVAAAILVLPVGAMATSHDPYVEYVDDMGGYDMQGLTMNGTAVRNVFAYDAEGEPLEGVQLFDQDGRPLEVLLDPQVDEFYDGEGRTGLRMSEDGTYEQVVPAVLANGRSLFNVFPLSLVPVVHDEMGNAVPSDEPATAPPAPFATAPEVVKPPKVAQSNE